MRENCKITYVSPITPLIKKSRVYLLDREAEAGCRRRKKSRHGAFTVRRKVTITPHKQAKSCKYTERFKLLAAATHCGPIRRSYKNKLELSFCEFNDRQLVTSGKSHCYSVSRMGPWIVSTCHFISTLSLRQWACAAHKLYLCTDDLTLFYLVIWMMKYVCSILSPAPHDVPNT